MKKHMKTFVHVKFGWLEADGEEHIPFHREYLLPLAEEVTLEKGDIFSFLGHALKIEEVEIRITKTSPIPVYEKVVSGASFRIVNVGDKETADRLDKELKKLGANIVKTWP